MASEMPLLQSLEETPVLGAADCRSVFGPHAMIASVICLLLAAGALAYSYWCIYNRDEPKLPHSTFYILQFRRVTDYGCLGIMAMPILLGLSRAFWLDNKFFIYSLSGVMVLVICTLLKNRILLAAWEKKQKGSQARIEIDESVIRIYFVDGSLASQTQFDDIVRLDDYQKEIPRGTRFEECTLRLNTGDEIVLNPLVERKGRLMRIIENRTGLEFGYRRNSQRHQRPKRRV